MLQQLLQIVIISAICCTWGLPLTSLTEKTIVRDHFWYRSTLQYFAFLFIAGAITLSILGSWLYLVMPLQFSSLLCLTLLPALWAAFFYRKKMGAILKELKKDSPPFSYTERIFLIICTLLFLVLASLKPANNDTQIYHLQIIRWALEYPAIPGTANLYLRLGLGSNWFGLISWLNIPFPSGRNFTGLNVTLTMGYFLWLFAHWKYHFHRLNLPASRILCLFYSLLILWGLFDWELFRDTANSTNYDLVVTACITMSICFLLEGTLTSPKNNFSIIFAFITAASIGFKLSGIFSLLLIGYHLIHSRSLKALLPLTLLLSIIFIPVLGKNYIITGYPLYPLSFSPGSPDWKVPKELTRLLQNYIVLSNRNYNQAFINTYQHNGLHWIPRWFYGLLWQQQVIIGGVILSVCLFFRKLPQTVDRYALTTLWPVLLLMIAAWFFTAPGLRFGYGVLLCTAFFPLCLLLAHRIRPGWYPSLLLLMSLACCIYGVGKAAVLLHNPGWLWQAANLENPPYQIVTIQGMPFRFPENSNGNKDHRCVDLPLPCICEENPYLFPRGRAVKDGFRMTPHPDSAFIQNYNY
ncbi:MAG TPA: hypothetical protein VL832_29385 [Puia sp.]|nr:hypothetical protein [Puia sp.]